MDTVNIKVSELKETVLANKKQHEIDYEVSCQGYRISVEEELTLLIENNANSEKVDDIKVSVPLQSPTNYSAEYDTVIRMLEMTNDDVVILTSNQFENYVMNNWHWSHHNNMLNSTYISKVVGR